MIRTDRWLREYAERLGINPEFINPASVDVCLGGEIIEYTYDRQYEQTNARTHHLEPGQEFTFKPGASYLAHTLERTTLPDDCAALILLKSSSGRKGLDHSFSGWGDPGFSGQWTFEFTAHRPATFKVGQRIAQLVFMQCDQAPEATYATTGRYQHQTGATPART